MRLSLVLPRRCAGPGRCSATPRAAGTEARGRRGRELLGQHRRAARRRPGGACAASSSTPTTDPHSYEPTASRRADDGGSAGRDRQRDRLRQLGVAAPRGRIRSGGRTRGHGRRRARPRRRRQPAPVVLAGRRAQGGRRDRRAAYTRVDPADAGYFAAPKRRLRARTASPATTRCGRRSAGGSRACRSATARASSRRSARASACGSSRRPASRRRSPRAATSALQDTARRSSASPRPPDQGLGLQQPERHPGGQQVNAIARAERIPVATVTETLSPATLDFEQWQVAELEALIAALHAATGPDAQRSAQSSCTAPRPRIGDSTIWSDVDLTIEPGELVAVLGPNGAGKSTLLRVLLGAPAACSAGPRSCSARARASATARSATSRSGTPSTRRPASAASTSSGSASTATAGACRSAADAPPRARVDEVIELVGASAYARRPIGELSGGEQQRLLIAQALAAEPELLLLDEPLDSLDLPNQTAVSALLARICRSEDVAVLLVAHDVNPMLARPRPGRLRRRRPDRLRDARAGDHERDAERALRRPDRGPAHLRRTARRRRPARGPAHHSDRTPLNHASPSIRLGREPLRPTRSWSTRSRRGRSWR